MHPLTLQLVGLRVEIRAGSVCGNTKRKAIHKNLGIKDISLMQLLSHSGLYSTAPGKNNAKGESR